MQADDFEVLVVLLLIITEDYDSASDLHFYDLYYLIVCYDTNP